MSDWLGAAHDHVLFEPSHGDTASATWMFAVVGLAQRSATIYTAITSNAAVRSALPPVSTFTPQRANTAWLGQTVLHNRSPPPPPRNRRAHNHIVIGNAGDKTKHNHRCYLQVWLIP